MRIKELFIFNFKSLQKLESLQLDGSLDIFAGANDSGKTSILYALYKFFKTGELCSFKNEFSVKSDLSISASDYVNLFNIPNFNLSREEIMISCILELDDIDMAQGSNLARLSSCNTILLSKKFSQLGCEYYIATQIYTNNDFNQLEILKSPELKALTEQYPYSKSILKNINNSGRVRNEEYIQALRVYAEANITKVNGVSPMPAKDLLADPLWPNVHFFDSSSSSLLSLIQQSFKKIDEKIKKKHKSATTQMETELKEYYSLVTGHIKDFSKRNYMPNLEEISAVPQINFSINQEIQIKKIGQISLSHIDLQGDGTKRRIMLAAMQCHSSIDKLIQNMDIPASVPQTPTTPTIQTATQTPPYEKLNIWLFDEPEIHLHPGAQRVLYNSLKSFSKENYQVFCSTHSTVFIDNSNLNSIHLLELSANETTILPKNKSSIEDAIKNCLGIKNSDLFFANNFIIVEGETEEAFLPYFYQKLSDNQKSFDSEGIKVIVAGGVSNLIQNMDRFTESLKNPYFLVDKDAEAEIKTSNSTKSTPPNNIFFIGKADFEDSFSDVVWKNLLEKHFSMQDSTGDSIWNGGISKARQDISLTEANKKFLKLIESCYKTNFMKNNDQSTEFDKEFKKVEIGKRLAEESIELKDYPKPIADLFEKISQNDC